MKCKKCRKEMDRITIKGYPVSYYQCICGNSIGKPTEEELKRYENKEEGKPTD